MKKIVLLIAAIVFAAVLANAQDGWVTHRADNRISIKFPTEPSEKVPGSFIAVSKDSSVAYIFTVVDFVQVANIDSVALAPVKATPEFAAQLKAGVQHGLNDVNLSDFVIGTWKGFTSYTASGTDDKNKRYDIFMVIIGNKAYSFSTVISKGASLQNRDDFLKTITLSN